MELLSFQSGFYICIILFLANKLAADRFESSKSCVPVNNLPQNETEMYWGKGVCGGPPVTFDTGK